MNIGLHKILPALLILPSVFCSAQSDSISESFNGICTHTVTEYKNYIFTYTSETGIEWNIKTYYVPDAGGLDDEGKRVESNDHCGTLFWTEGKSGYARATIAGGISSLSFDAASGWNQNKGFVRVLVDGIEVGRTGPVSDQEVRRHSFAVNTPGPLDLELVHGIDGTSGGGILLDNLTIHSKEGSRPFFAVEKLEEFDPRMDTLKTISDTMEIFYYAEGCLMVNGEFIDYFDPVDNKTVTFGSVIDLDPGDSCNIYYWGYAMPGSTGEVGQLPLEMFLPVNSETDTVPLASTGGGDNKDGILSFVNGNVDYDLVVFRIPDLNHEYRIRFAFDHYQVQSTSTDDKSFRPSVRFFPNPVQNHAWFETDKDLLSFEILDMNGRILSIERDPPLTGEGLYKLNLENLHAGIWIVRFHYADHTLDAVRILVE